MFHRTIISGAASEDDLASLMDLMSAGITDADFLATDDVGRTALMCAAARGYGRTVQKLLAAGFNTPGRINATEPQDGALCTAYGVPSQCSVLLLC